jgi:hypothetical protein
MIGQYLSNNNETATVAFRQKNCQLNSLLKKSKKSDSGKFVRDLNFLRIMQV